MDVPLAAIILAAGLGTRMRSQRSKVLHELSGQPILAYALRAIATTQPFPLILVVGHQAQQVESVARSALPGREIVTVFQDRQLGTADAARVGLQMLPPDFSGDVLIGYGDMPMLTPGTLSEFLEYHRSSSAAVSFISVRMTRAGSYGRVVRDVDGTVEAIVEARDATPAELSITEVNTGVY